MKKVVAFSTLAVLTGLTLAGCGSGKAADQDKPLNVTMPAELQVADPNKATDAYSFYMMRQTTEGLYRLNKNGKVVAGMATKLVKPTADGTKYVFNLRKDAHWSNGDKVTAQDFVTSFRRQVDPKTKAQYANRLAMFKNYDAVQKGTKAPSALGVKADGKYKLEFELSKSDPTFNFELATQLLPVNTKLVAKYGDKYGTNSSRVAANGPYVLKNWNGTKDTWTYAKNNKYYDKQSVRIKKVNVQVVKTPSTALNLFSSGKLQETTASVTGTTVKQVENTPKLKKQMVKTLTSAISLQQFNKDGKVSGNANFRKAAAAALNVKQMTDKVTQDGSQPLKGMVATGNSTDPNTGKDFATAVGNLNQHSDAKAKAYWQKAKKELGGGSQTVNLLISNTDNNKNVAEYVQSQWEKDMPGLKVTITSVPLQQEINKMFKKDFDVAQFGWTGDEPDPTTDLALFQKGNSINFTGWNDKQFNKLMDQANQTTDTKARFKLLKQATKRAAEVRAFNPLYQQAQVSLVSSKVGGLKYSEFSTAAQYRYAYWK
ncbi:oligopeptide ABC transporter substrate-binding protein [Secundilactobacillus oryzae JCM 18671]|uniref:Oligopeptide ABC transporter substrate-binding protein n=1 Tax=Secundilactobacillus oryzae JCM 18671 TaxID=1291743 RepID=A0A081BIW4_9LACO|nr:peptide ABC transporter substrate-binding protein [Secundilactobacillus oryzae]GAK47982.1 oligopeptide ABC transporter substrate-binding protein [Secundilactobacillus oryzae JCM 18671]